MKKRKINVANEVQKIHDRFLVTNMVKLAKHHKKYCEGEKCTIILNGIPQIFDRAGIKLTKKQQEVFL